jgi:hypothetical protein
LWQVQEYGLLYDRAVMDAGAAARAACQRVHPALSLQGAQWHVLHTWSQVQGRLERIWRAWHKRTAAVERQAGRVAAGLKPRGGNPQTDVSAHALRVARAKRVVDDVRYLGRELHRLLSVVVLDHYWFRVAPDFWLRLGYTWKDAGKAIEDYGFAMYTTREVPSSDR